MRTVALLLFALLLAHSTTAQQAPASQPEARALEERWKNCSEVIHGRLGALHPVNHLSKNFALVFNTSYGVEGSADPHVNVTLTYSPCVAPFVTIVRNEYPQTPISIIPALDDYTPVDGRVVDFVMQETSDDKTHFTGIYHGSVHHTEATSITVVTNCGYTDEMVSKNITLVKGENGKLTGTIVLSTLEACPRFPYTNKDMPGGAIAALVVILVCFALELAACGWYHKTYSTDSPFTTNAAYNNVE